MPHSQLKFESFIYLMKKNWPDAYKGLFLLFPRIERIASDINNKIDNIMKAQDLLASDFHLLTAIRRSNSVPPFELKPSELCNYMLFSWGGLSKVMKRLEAKEIITRVSSEEDKRISMIRLTEKGRSIVDTSVLELQTIQAQLLDGFTNEEITLLDKLLAKLVNNIES
ncbi:MarR family winged helix-turn-helix transcriptional regulator [Psychromonas algicola]|uniref:MarR family winged helix-turn-helix transcriptional regulator n=1 Tax=Psychromonas algicola TaxID=2555642 RepID=UPI00106842C1|nr:MarR family transcriptional regulator [Psychromonas sp. RZ5]TEW44475.1 MarR family transcriptional regulator [Psychromonas sp. RZ5]